MNWITRLAAQALSKHGVRTKQARREAEKRRQAKAYRDMNNELAAIVGKQIPWAKP